MRPTPGVAGITEGWVPMHAHIPYPDETHVLVLLRKRLLMIATRLDSGCHWQPRSQQKSLSRSAP
jgi:hypothetical protein